MKELSREAQKQKTACDSLQIFRNISINCMYSYNELDGRHQDVMGMY